MSTERRPWNPDPAWADPLLVLLALLCLLGSALALATRARARQVQAPVAVSLQGRFMDVALGLPIAFGTPGRALPRGEDLPNPWDRALVAIFAAESQALEPARKLADQGPPGPFRAAFAAAYEGGPAVAPDPALLEALGGGLAARLLEARLGPEGTRAAARKAALDAQFGRMAGLVAVGLVTGLLGLGGVVYGVLLLTQRKAPWPAGPRWEGLAWRGAALAFLGWFAGYFLLGLLVSALASAWPALRPWALPLGYLAHAAWGLGLILLATGRSLGGLARDLAPGKASRAVTHALGGWGLAIVALFLLGLVLTPLLRGRGSPQEEVMEGLRAAQGATVLPLFLTVAVLAPCFEELMMRGFLLGHLRGRWGAGRAVLVTSLLFGFVHLQPLAIPSLGTLGGILGLLVLRTGDLRASILLHALWNGSLFLLVRTLA